MRDEVRRKNTPVVVRQSRLVHLRLHDHPHRAEGRQVAGIRAIGDHQRHQKRRNARRNPGRHRQRCDQGAGSNRARADHRKHTSQSKKQRWQQRGRAAAESHAASREHAERAVDLGDAKQQRHAGQSQKQRRREKPEHRVRFPSGGINPHRKRQGHREDTDVDPRGQAEENHRQQREEGKRGGAHGASGVDLSKCFCTLPNAVRGIAATRTNALGCLNDASCVRRRATVAASSKVAASTTT